MHVCICILEYIGVGADAAGDMWLKGWLVNQVPCCVLEDRLSALGPCV